MHIPKYSHVHTNLGIQKAGKVEEKEELEMILKWENYFLM